MKGAALPWRALTWSVGVTAGATALSSALFPHEETTSHLIVYLIGILFLASRFGFWPSALAALLSVLASDFLLIQPYFSFAVARPQDGVALGVFLLAGLVTSRLTADLRERGDAALLREQRVRLLYELTRALAGARSAPEVAEIAAGQSSGALPWRCQLLLAGPDGQLEPDQVPAWGADATLAQWVIEQRQPAGWGTATVPQQDLLYLPVGSAARRLGVLVLRPAAPALFLLPDQRQLVDTVLSLLGQTLERIRLAQEAQAASLRIETETLRNSLLNAIAHDLRTPLAAITAAASTLLHDRALLSRDQAQELTQTILEEGRRMAGLADSTLELARLEAGTVTLRRDWYPVEEIVGAALSRMEPALRGHKVATALPQDPVLAQVDAVMIVRVLENLLGNAIKYAPPGTLIALGAEDATGLTRLRVADAGPGLVPGEEERIFDKFYRGSAGQAQPGVGLGLAICRILVEAHGGTIAARNLPGGGAEFCVTIPHTEAAPRIPADEEAPQLR